MTCKQLGGGCDLEFKAETWEEMSQLSNAHGKEMIAKEDPAHMEAMMEMRKLMETGGMAEWYQKKQEEFEALPHD